ncbi:hypothetical protein BC937DRAFT_86702 [Endogone sp. FLAS-F59071]|nr:hypothetical protein BC937DRAFT_86702 [Endogone sp. FLAS-F59071]|eukprot:RUS19931.1 hypothetical protein BC937DRAFT_86702 [Endogone sp. FLAS-F59071]
MTDQTDDNQQLLQAERREYEYSDGGAPEDMPNTQLPNTQQDPNDHGRDDEPAQQQTISDTSEVILAPVSKQADSNDDLVGFTHSSDRTSQTATPSLQTTTTTASTGDVSEPESDNCKANASDPTWKNASPESIVETSNNNTESTPQKDKSPSATDPRPTPSTMALQQEYPISHESAAETGESTRLNPNFESDCRDKLVHNDDPATDPRPQKGENNDLNDGPDITHVLATPSTKTLQQEYPISHESTVETGESTRLDPNFESDYRDQPVHNDDPALPDGNFSKDKTTAPIASANTVSLFTSLTIQPPQGMEATPSFSIVPDEQSSSEKTVKQTENARILISASAEVDYAAYPAPCEDMEHDDHREPTLVASRPLHDIFTENVADPRESMTPSEEEAEEVKWRTLLPSPGLNSKLMMDPAGVRAQARANRGRSATKDAWEEEERNEGNVVSDDAKTGEKPRDYSRMKQWHKKVKKKKREKAPDAWACDTEQTPDAWACDTEQTPSVSDEWAISDGWSVPREIKPLNEDFTPSPDPVGQRNRGTKKKRNANNAAKDAMDAWEEPPAAKDAMDAWEEPPAAKDAMNAWEEPPAAKEEQNVNNAAKGTTGTQNGWGDPPPVTIVWGSEYEGRTDVRVENMMHPSVGRASRTDELWKLRESPVNNYNGGNSKSQKKKWPKPERPSKFDDENEIDVSQESASVGGYNKISKESKGAGGKREVPTSNANDSAEKNRIDIEDGRRYDNPPHQNNREKNIKNLDSRPLKNATSFTSYESKDDLSRLDNNVIRNFPGDTWLGSDTVKSNRVPNSEAASFVLSASTDRRLEFAYSPDDALSASGVFVPQADGYGATSSIADMNNNFVKSLPATIDTTNSTTAWQQTQLRDHLQAQSQSSSVPPTATLPNGPRKGGSMDSMWARGGSMDSTWARKGDNGAAGGNSTSMSLDNSNQTPSPLNKGSTTGGANTELRKNSLARAPASGGESGHGWRTGTPQNDRSAAGATVTSPDKYGAEHYSEHMDPQDPQGYSFSSAPHPTWQPVSPATGHNPLASHPHRHSGSASIATESTNAFVSPSMSGGSVSPQILCFYCGAGDHTLSRDCPFIPTIVPKTAWLNLLKADEMQGTQEFTQAFDAFTKACPTETFQDIETKLKNYKCNFHLVAFNRELPPNKKLFDLQGQSGYRYPIAIIFLGDNGGINNEPISSAPVFSRLRAQPGVPITDEQNMLWLANGGFPRDPREVPLCKCCLKEGHWASVCPDTKI